MQLRLNCVVFVFFLSPRPLPPCTQSELPRLDMGGAPEPVHYSAPPCVSHNGFLFKTASMSRAVTERKAREGRTSRTSRSSAPRPFLPLARLPPTHRSVTSPSHSLPSSSSFASSSSEFTRRWCSLNDGCFSYYESDRSSAPNGTMKTSEIVCVAVDPPDKHG